MRATRVGGWVSGPGQGLTARPRRRNGTQAGAAARRHARILPNGCRSAKKQCECSQRRHDHDAKQNPVASTAGGPRKIKTICARHGGAERCGGAQVARLTSRAERLNEGLNTNPQHPSITPQGTPNERPARQIIPVPLLHRLDLASRQTHPLSGLLDRPSAGLAHGRQFCRGRNP